jgi:uncharacterized protein YjcR
MGKLKEFLLNEEEKQMELDEIDAMWHQKQLEEYELIEIAKKKNMFEWQAIQDAIYYSKRLKIVEGK